MFSLRNTLSLHTHTHAHTTCIPFWLCSQPQLTRLFTLKLAGSPGQHDESSRGHGLWLLFRLLFAALAFSQYLQSGSFPGAVSLRVWARMPLPVPGHWAYPWPAAPCLPCWFRMSRCKCGSCEQWKGHFLMKTEAGGKNSQMRIP